MASSKDPKLPKTMTMMGGPIDPRRNPTQVNALAMRKGRRWFENNVIFKVPAAYPGYLRSVYPGFLQHAGFVAMNPDRHLKSHWDYYLDLVKGDQEDVDDHRKFYDEYNAVIDLPAEYYLDTIKVVFKDHLLPDGKWRVRGQLVKPEDIRTVALFTIEGELDDISGSGQTQAAHELCKNIPKSKKRHLTAERRAITASSAGVAGAKRSRRKSRNSFGQTTSLQTPGVRALARESKCHCQTESTPCCPRRSARSAATRVVVLTPKQSRPAKPKSISALQAERPASSNLRAC